MSNRAEAPTKQDFKAAHFKFGNQNTRYVTTNSDNYNDQIMKDAMDQMAEQKRGKNFHKEKQDRLNKQKQQNFAYGNEGPQFTTVAQKNFVKHDLSSVPKANATQ